MYKTLLKYLFCCFPLIVSCEKAVIEKDAQTDAEAVFEEVWSFADRYYSFFEYKEIDWDEVYSRYRPQVREGMSDVELFDLCADMLYELKDGHVNLVSPFDRSRYWEWYLDSPENFYYSIIERNYFKDRQRYIGPLEFLEMNDIIYIYYGSFAQPISKGNMAQIIGALEDKSGLIIDVRNNGGGSTENARMLASHFTDEKVFAGYNYMKDGPEHDDFRRREVHIEPSSVNYTGDVIVLTNRKSYSATTYFVQYMSELPNVTFVGDTTGGGGGMPAFRDLPNGWLLRVSSTMFYSPDGFNIESGIPPDVQVDMSKESISEGRDDILDTAVNLLENEAALEE